MVQISIMLTLEPEEKAQEKICIEIAGFGQVWYQVFDNFKVAASISLPFEI